MSEFLQFFLSGLAVGAVYALVALGFTIIYNASDVVNFAQGEFVMLGGMITATAFAAGWSLPFAALFAVIFTALVGVALNKFAIEPARGAPVVSIIIITIGASIFIQGLTQVFLGKQLYRFPAFSGEAPIRIFGATLVPQNLWVFFGAILIFVLLWLFFNKTLLGRAVLRSVINHIAVLLVGVYAFFVLIFLLLFGSFVINLVWDGLYCPQLIIALRHYWLGLIQTM